MKKPTKTFLLNCLCVSLKNQYNKNKNKLRSLLISRRDINYNNKTNNLFSNVIHLFIFLLIFSTIIIIIDSLVIHKSFIHRGDLL